MPALLNYLGLGGRPNGTGHSKDNSPVRALPASWYTTQEMYEFERRAIFSKKWMLITHQMRLSEPGDWLKFDAAGYEFVVAKDRKGIINAFHNVCRHRAYPVIEGQSGSAKIFSCRYHGWSYGLDGKLAKAPKYDELEGFDKSQNGLLPIHLHIDKNGFVWVNLDAGEVPEIAWEEDFAGIDMQERYKAYNFDDYRFDHMYQMEGNYNWKILADNFNECYHCPTSHPDIPTLADITTHDVTPDLASIKHQSGQNEEQEKKGLAISSTYFFPNVSISILPNWMMLQRFLPNGPSRSIMQYQIFRHKDATDENFKIIDELYKKVVSEDKGLCEAAQRNLNAGIFVNGEMHPRLEKGPLYFQKVAREVIRAHFDQEKAAKREIWPAQQRMPDSAIVSKEDMEICSGLMCGGNQEQLAW